MSDDLFVDEGTVKILFAEIKRLRKLMYVMAKALMNPGDEKLRVLALAHYEQTFRGGTP